MRGAPAVNHHKNGCVLFIFYKIEGREKNGVPFAGGVGCYNQKTNEGKRQHKKFKPCEAQWSVRRIQADDAPDIVSN